MARTKRPTSYPEVDEFAEIQAARSEIEKKYNRLRQKLLSLGLPICHGKTHIAVLIERTRNGLDTNLLRADMGDEWCDQYSKVTNYYEVKVVPNA